MEVIKKNDNIINRLRRIEGQVKGIEKMVTEEKYCGDILTQIAAARSALNKVGGLILESHMKKCLKEKNNSLDNDTEIDKLIDTMIKYTK